MLPFNGILMEKVGWEIIQSYTMCWKTLPSFCVWIHYYFESECFSSNICRYLKLWVLLLIHMRYQGRSEWCEWGGPRYMCEYGQHGVLSVKPRSGWVKQVRVWGRCEPPRGGGSRGTAPSKFTNFRPSRGLEIALSTL